MVAEFKVHSLQHLNSTILVLHVVILGTKTYELLMKNYAHISKVFFC